MGGLLAARDDGHEVAVLQEEDLDDLSMVAVKMEVSVLHMVENFVLPDGIAAFQMLAQIVAGAALVAFGDFGAWEGIADFAETKEENIFVCQQFLALEVLAFDLQSLVYQKKQHLDSTLVQERVVWTLKVLVCSKPESPLCGRQPSVGEEDFLARERECSL